MKSAIGLTEAPAVAASIAFARFALLAAAALLPVSLHAQPREGIWVAYAPSGARTTETPSAPGISNHAHSDIRPPVFSVRLLSRHRPDLLRAELLFPGAFDRSEVTAARVGIQRVDLRDSRYQQARTRFHRMLDALEHHRPALTMIVPQTGPSTLVRDETQTRFERCGEQRASALVDELLSVVENEEQRENWVRRRRQLPQELAPSTDYPALLIGALALELPLVENGPWTRLQARLDADRREAPPATQATWRSEQIRLAGREFGLNLNLLGDLNSAAAQLCRTVTLREIQDPTSDQCSIGGFIDTRDNWPIVLSVTRIARTSGQASESQVRNFYRLAPLQGFVPPPDPCRAVATR